MDSLAKVIVLEHTRDDGTTLDRIFRILVPGGKAVLFAMALPWIYGSLDESFEHLRRYTMTQLRSLLTRVGFQIYELRYFNSPGVLAWFLAAKLP